MQFELVVEGKADHLLVPYFKDIIPTQWEAELRASSLTGNPKDLYAVWTAEASQHFYFLGLGNSEELAQVSEIVSSFLFKKQNQLGPHLMVDLRHLPTESLYQVVLGVERSQYKIGSHKTEAEAQKILEKVSLLVSEPTAVNQEQLTEAQHTGSVVNRTMALVDAPANWKTPQYLAKWAQDSAAKYGYLTEILDKQALEEAGFEALLAVGQGSVHAPVLIKMEYRPVSKEPFQLGLVGKGVTFDTGGISIKKSTNMHYMKSDMGGAAAVMGAIELIARLQLPINVVAVVPVAENAVDGRSIRPGDVIGSYSHKSIEIIDTDAEGRLILADGLSFIQEAYNPQTVIDLATLTGSSVATLGFHAAAIFTNNDQLCQALEQAGNQVHERLWRLPLWEAYEEDLHSDVADVKNYSGKPVAGAITAAKFLEFFIKEHSSWAHLDIAGTAFGNTEHAKMKSATGYGVRLLLTYAQSISKK